MKIEVGDKAKFWIDTLATLGMAFALIFSHKTGNQFLSNIALAGLWISTCCAFIATGASIFAQDNDLLVDDLSKRQLQILVWISTIVGVSMIGLSHYISGVIYLISHFLYCGASLSELNKETKITVEDND